MPLEILQVYSTLSLRTILYCLTSIYYNSDHIHFPLSSTQLSSKEVAVCPILETILNADAQKDAVRGRSLTGEATVMVSVCSVCVGVYVRL